MYIAATQIETSPTLISAGNYQSPARILQNSGDVAILIGDQDVSATDAARALTLAPGAIFTIPSGGGQLYGVAAAGTGAVTVLALGG